MAFESFPVAVVASLLSLSGIPTVAVGNYLYLVDARRAVQIQIGVVDGMSFLLFDFFYVFSVWTYVAVKGGGLTTKRYFAMALAGLPIIFLGNALKIFAQIFAAISSGTRGSSLDAILASTDAIGFAVMFGIVLTMVCATCLWLGRGVRSQFG